MIELRTLGGVDLRGADGREVGGVLAQPKRFALLAYLAVARPRGFHRRDVLLALFWPELGQEAARGALRKAVHVVRRALGAEAVLRRGDEELGLAKEVWCDAVAFEQALEERRFSEALQLYQGDLLEGFYISDAPEFERWVDRERSRLREQAGGAAWALADQSAAEERDAAAVTLGRRAMSFTPTDEAALRRLVVLLYRMGDRAAALHAYNEFACRLLEEYGVRPSAQTRKLVEVVKTSGDVPGQRLSKLSPAPPAKPHA